MYTTINKKSISVFELTGKDVLSFLNNQVVSDLSESIDSPKFTAICNPKGRIIFTLFLQKSAETTWVAVDSSLSDTFLQYVNMRRFRMDLMINKSENSLAINAQKGDSSSDDLKFTHEVNMPVIENDDYWLFMFKAGLPWITKETSEHYIPQHLNLDQLGVIDFDKGCYPGQEIVARLHFLGKIKKRMQYVQYQAEQPSQINTSIKTPEYDRPLEFCSPAIFYQNLWHAQAVTAV